MPTPKEDPKEDPEDLSHEHIRNICLLSQGVRQCAFLHITNLGWAKCRKRDPHLRMAIRSRIDRDDPTLIPRGDNCTGPDTFLPNTPLSESTPKP